jgi:hypothetical protein
MRAARPIFGGNVRTLDMKRLHRRSFIERLARGGQIPQGPHHLLWIPSDNRWKAPRNARREHHAQAPGDFFVLRIGRIVIDSRESVDLNIDEPGCDVNVLGALVGEGRIQVLNHFVELDGDPVA